MDRPNILYLHVHDIGRYVQPYGYAVPTPNIQKLAERGILFRQAYCVSPSCSASRAALLTGQCCHTNGMLGLAHRGFELVDYGHHIVHTLRKAGYHSALIGTQHIASPPYRKAEDIGYDEIVPLDKDADRHEITRTWLADPPGKPFFLSVGYSTTHRNFPEPGPDQDERYVRPPDPLPDTKETRHDFACFQRDAATLDDEFGQVLDALDEANLTDSTLVICTTDHGVAFPHMKCNLNGHGMGVMLVLAGPGGFEGGTACDALVSHVDVVPTVCDLLDIETPEWVEGRSLMPLIRGETEEVNEQIFGEVTFHASYEPMRSVRTQRWNYIRRYESRTRPVLPNCDDSVSKDLLMAAGWGERRPADEQLYDLLFDPNEACNRAGDEACADVLTDMRRRLDTWMEATNDPLLEGPVPLPKGAKANDPDGVSPQETCSVAE
jgi:N-sulfoglucosamine sulfohydrolase